MDNEKKSQSQDLRFKYYHQIDELYHQILDELSLLDLPDMEIGRLAQTVMLSRQEGLKQLVSLEEMKGYYEQYPQEE